jgi:hypothetical protein
MNFINSERKIQRRHFDGLQKKIFLLREGVGGKQKNFFLNEAWISFINSLETVDKKKILSYSAG